MKHNGNARGTEGIRMERWTLIIQNYASLTPKLLLVGFSLLHYLNLEIWTDKT
jgi:hypothetical protein